MEVIPVQFDILQLWLLNEVIPDNQTHNLAEKWDGTSLRQQIQKGLLFCADTGEDEATLLINDEHATLITLLTPFSAMASNGRPLGREVLFKCFRTAEALRFGQELITEEPATPSKAEIADLLQKAEKEGLL